MVNEIVILHLADLHMQKNKIRDIQYIIDALINDIKKFQQEHGITIDCICFTGDLIQRGDYATKYENQFYLATEHLVIPLLCETRLDFDRFFFVPGNHEVDRSVIDEYTEVGIKTELSSTEKINHFIDNLNTRYIERMSEYLNFRDKYLNHYVKSTLLYSTYKFNKGTYTVGVACLNSAWMSSGDNDKGNLIIGERQVDDAFNSIADCSIKIALAHHPTYWLMEHDKYSVDIAYGKYDLILTGHLHNTKDQLIFSGGKSTIYSSCGSLFQGKSEYNGYTIITIKPDANLVTMYFRQYYDTRREFDQATAYCKDGKVDLIYQVGREKNLIALNLVKNIKQQLINQFNKNLLTNLTESSAPKDLKNIFVEPVLALESEYKKEEESKDNIVEFNKLLQQDKNVMFIGKKEIGKTTIIHYICLYYLENYSCLLKLPFLINFNELYLAGKDVIEKYLVKSIIECTNYDYSISREQVKEILNSGECVILIDNFDIRNQKHINILKEFTEKYSSNRYILATNESLYHTISVYQYPYLGIPYEKIYIQTLERKQIRQLINNWFSQSQDDVDIDRFLDRITSHLFHINMPRTPLIISLLLAVCEEQNDYEPINESSLLERFIELILEKLSPEDVKFSTYDYRIKEDYLSQLAWEMVCNDKYCFTDSEYEQITYEYFYEKALSLKKSKFDTLFFEKGILVKNKGHVFFRYKCFFEYFLAKKMQNDAEAYDYLLSTNEFIEFSNEIIFLSGLQRNNIDLLNKIAGKLNNSLDEISQLVNLEDLRAFKIKGLLNVNNDFIEELKKSKLSIEEKDKVLDWNGIDYKFENQLVVKNVQKDNSDDLIEILMLYARVLKNSELIDRSSKISNLKKCIECFCFAIAMIFYVIEKKITKEEVDKTLEYKLHIEDDTIETAKDILKITIPIVFQNIIYEAIGSRKFEEIICDLFKRTENEFVKFMYLFLYADLRLPNYLEYVKEFTNEIKSKDLLHLAFFKLYFYYNLRSMPEAEENELLSLISDIVISIKRTNKFVKDKIMYMLKDRNTDAKTILLKTSEA